MTTILRGMEVPARSAQTERFEGRLTVAETVEPAADFEQDTPGLASDEATEEHEREGEHDARREDGLLRGRTVLAREEHRAARAQILPRTGVHRAAECAVAAMTDDGLRRIADAPTVFARGRAPVDVL